MSAIDTMKAALFGNPPQPGWKPDRAGVMSAFTSLYDASVIAIYAAEAGLTTVADIAARDTFYATEANQGKLVYVNNNNGSADDPANGVYEYVDGAARIAEGFTAGLEAVVRPLVDEARDAAASAQAATAPIAQVLRTGGGRGLYALKKALSDPLTQFVGLTLIGDSITWGMTVTGGLAVDPYPRTATFADARNNATAPTWANLLHTYLGREYYSDTSVTATAWPGSSAGVAVFGYAKSVVLFPEGGDFEVTNSNSTDAGVWTTAYDPSSYTGGYINFAVDSSLDDARLTFPFSGYKFKLVFTAFSDGADYELYVNGVLKGVYATSTTDASVGGPVRYGVVREHDLGGFVKNATVSIKVVPGNVARRIFRAEALVIDREIRVTNNGIVGTDTVGWSRNLINDAVQDGDSFAIVQLGTNDRYVAPADYRVPNGIGMFRRYLEAITEVLESRKVTPILASANAVVVEGGYFTMSDVRGVIATCADARGYDFVDHYAPTSAQLASGDDSFLADGLHPGDSGHAGMFARWKDAIDSSMAR